MYRILIPVAVITAAVMPTNVFAQFFEDWDDGSGAARWSAPIVAQEDFGIAFDGIVDYAFDYSAIGAPSAPKSQGGTTIGVSMQTNLTDQCPADANCIDSDEGESVGIVPLSGLADIPTGDFLLTADMYLYWNGQSGSTEYGTMGVFSRGLATPLRFNLDNGDGLAWSVDSEGDSGADILRFENPPGTEIDLGGYEDIPDGSIPGVGTGTALQIGPFNQWVELAIASSGGIVSFSMNGYTINTFDNTGGQFSGGTLLIGQSDPFNSVNPGGVGASNMAVFDNISLVVPEPGSLLLLGLSILFTLCFFRQC